MSFHFLKNNCPLKKKKLMTEVNYSSEFENSLRKYTELKNQDILPLMI